MEYLQCAQTGRIQCAGELRDHVRIGSERILTYMCMDESERTQVEYHLHQKDTVL